LVNDFSALGAGIPYLSTEELLTLQTGVPMQDGPLALIGAGTGLGEAFLTWNGQYYTVHPSEGGHSSFAPQTTREWQLYSYLRSRFDHVSAERILSGSGLYAVYCFLVDIEQFSESQTVATEMQHEVPEAVITRHAVQQSDHVCIEAVNFFMDVYGAQAGNLALTVLATGGVYIAGGVALHIAKCLQNGRFIQAFSQKGRMRDMLTNIPVHVITSQQTALLGATVLATRI
jgi:glucokinase